MELTDEDGGEAPRVRSRQARAWLAIVLVFVGVSVLALVGVLFGMGPFSGMQSVFVHKDSVWGTCYLTDMCDGIPLSTLEEATGLTFAEGTTIVDSSYSGLKWDSGDFTALIRIPLGESSPLAGAAGTALANSSGKYATAAKELQGHGATNLIVFDPIGTVTTIIAPYSRTGGWAMSGTADNGTYIYVSATLYK